jgi:hypothetical protein
MAYFRPDGIRFVDYFPWVTVPAEPARSYAGAFVDQSYRTGSVTAFMPWLLALTMVAVPVLFRPGVDLPRRMLRVPLVAGVLVTGGVMAYGYFAFRYTSEFVPALVIGGAVGTCALSHALRDRRFLLGGLVAVAALAAAFSVTASMLTGHAAAAATYGGPELADYLRLQHRLSASAQAGLVTTGEDVPEGSGRTDEIYVQGDCDAVYLASGDHYQPWLLVERRSVVVTATVSRSATATRLELARIDTEVPSSVWLQTDGDGRARLLVITHAGTSTGMWFDVLPPGTIRVGLRDLPELGYAQISSTPGGQVGYLPSSEHDEDWVAHPLDISITADPDLAAAHGISVRVDRGLTPPLCEQLTGGD